MVIDTSAIAAILSNEPERARFNEKISADDNRLFSKSCLGTPCRGFDMLSTCKYVIHMSKMIQLRNVPDSLHRKLKARAALEGMSLSDYLVAEIRRSAEQPTVRELRERLRQRAPVAPKIPPADAVREERNRL